MLKLNLQFFAHKKGMGSTRNGRESESKRLGPKRADGQFSLAGNIPCTPRWMASFVSSVWAATRSRSAFILWLSNDKARRPVRFQTALVFSFV